MHLQSAKALILLVCGIFAGTALADPDHVYLENDGIILFESEDGTFDAGWELQTEIADYQGSGYLLWTGPPSYLSSAAGKGTITYHFRIESAGNYQLLLRSRITSGESNTESNDSWVRLATGSDVPDEEPLDGWTKLYMNKLGEWTWTSKTVDHVGRPIRQYFTQGDHTVEISGRSVGHAVDRVALYQYEEVPYNSDIINGWALSSVLTGDGTVINPNQNTDPVDPAPEVPVSEVPLENLVAADDDWSATLNNVCTGNMLALPASSTRSVNPAELASAYTMGEFLTVSPGESSVLMKFDLSLAPTFSSALLEYSTGIKGTDGTVYYSLGSHSEWPSEDGEDNSIPDAMIAMSQASGGWQLDTRYQSEIPAALLTSELITIILSSDEASEPLSIFSYLEAEQSPRLLLMGDDDFCDNWRSNVDAQNAPVEPPPEINEIPIPEPEITEPVESSEPKTTSSGGGFTSWLSLVILFAGLFMQLIRNNKRQSAANSPRSRTHGISGTSW